MKLLSIAVLAITIYYLYLSNLFVVKDLNAEAIDLPLTCHYLQEAHQLKLSPHEYFNRPEWSNYRSEASKLCNNYPRGRFWGDWFSYQTVLVACELPFVCAFGVHRGATLCSIFYCLIAFWLTQRLGEHFKVRWLPCVFMLTSTSFLIHTKTAMYQFMPSVCLMLLTILCLLSSDWDSYLWLGVVLAFCVLTGWIVAPFAVLTSIIVIYMKDREHIWMVSCLILPTFFLTILTFETLYGQYFHASLWEMNICLYDMYASRLSSSPVTLHLWEKPLYALKCIFWDMKTFDHSDKMLAGFPSIPPIFSAFFFIGLWQIIKNQFSSSGSS